MTSNDDFELQLRLEAEEAERKRNQVKETENPYLTRDPNDGTLYEWDPQRKAWFPKIDDDFIAMYQASYGVSQGQDEGGASTLNTTTASKTTNEQTETDKQQQQQAEKEVEEEEKEEEKKKNELKPSTNEQLTRTASDSSKRASDNEEASGSAGKRAKKADEWFEMQDEYNRNVYVNNLPENTTEDEFVAFMSKCGMVMKDPNTNRFKVKLYRDSNGQPKGDALCTYIKVESVQLAEQILDGALFNGREIKVEKAKFQLKGQYDPSKKPRKPKAKDKQKMKQKIEHLFSWKPDKLRGEREKREKVIILKNMFDPNQFLRDPTLILEYRSDVMSECEQTCGPVKKVEVYDRHAEGVVAVFFNEFDAADKCVELMNGRWFAGRQLSAQHWDGRTRYKVQETEEEAAKRIAEWDKYLEQ